MWVHVMLEMAESLSETKRMVLMSVLSSAKGLEIDMPTASVNDSPLWVLDFLLKPHAPLHIMSL